MNPQVEAANDNRAPEWGELLADAEARLDVSVEPEITEEVNRWARIVSDLEAKREAVNDNSKAIKKAA